MPRIRIHIANSLILVTTGTAGSFGDDVGHRSATIAADNLSSSEKVLMVDALSDG